MGANRKKDHLIKKGFSYSCEDKGGEFLVKFTRDVCGIEMVFGAHGPTEKDAIVDAALDANMYMHRNRDKFPDVYGELEKK